MVRYCLVTKENFEYCNCHQHILGLNHFSGAYRFFGINGRELRAHLVIMPRSSLISDNLSVAAFYQEHVA